MINESKNIPLNQILYGPSGTGKTYNTVIEAMRIIKPGLIEKYENDEVDYEQVREEFNNYKNRGQIEFITFHQSYSYEEFVEGIKPDIHGCGETDNQNTDKSDIKYIVRDGVFKKIRNYPLT